MPSLFTLAQIFGFAAFVHGHCSLIRIQGSNGIIGHAFGLDLYGRYPRIRGQPGDAGGDSGIFQTGTNNPNPPCGGTPELGPLDVSSWLSQAEGDGLPAAYANGSIVAQAFQVNRDGGGPMSCEFNEDATATSFKPMTMILNQSGNKGIRNQNRVNETVVMEFPEGARCTGGWTETACIIRCRTGVNKRFGGCFAAKLADSVNYDFGIHSAVSSTHVSSTLTSQQISQITAEVIAKLKASGYVIARSAASRFRF